MKDAVTKISSYNAALSLDIQERNFELTTFLTWEKQGSNKLQRQKNSNLTDNVTFPKIKHKQKLGIVPDELEVANTFVKCFKNHVDLLGIKTEVLLSSAHCKLMSISSSYG